jgi:hypothetical protein
VTQQHPITPPPELVQAWSDEALTASGMFEVKMKFATYAARWGSDQELEACCEWFQDFYKLETWMQRDLKKLRDARRPKPPSLKEQALVALYAVATGANDIREQHQDFETIRRALEALPD